MGRCSKRENEGAPCRWCQGAAAPTPVHSYRPVSCTYSGRYVYMYTFQSNAVTIAAHSDQLHVDVGHNPGALRASPTRCTTVNKPAGRWAPIWASLHAWVSTERWPQQGTATLDGCRTGAKVPWLGLLRCLLSHFGELLWIGGKAATAWLQP
jgi:hypothetical protein